LAVYIAQFFVLSAHASYKLKKNKDNMSNLWHCQRKKINETLQYAKDKQIIFVRYGQNHNYHHEWVYNEADIDNARCIWARDLGKEKNNELIRYYPEREVRLLEYDSGDNTMILSKYKDE